jgi:hypothetical protein
MKFVTPSQFADPDAAARKLVEIANAVEGSRTDEFSSNGCSRKRIGIFGRSGSFLKQKLRG